MGQGCSQRLQIPLTRQGLVCLAQCSPPERAVTRALGEPGGIVCTTRMHTNRKHTQHPEVHTCFAQKKHIRKLPSRVPSLLVTARGTLLAFGEGRGLRNRVCSDHGDVMASLLGQK